MTIAKPKQTGATPTPRQIFKATSYTTSNFNSLIPEHPINTNDPIQLLGLNLNELSTYHVRHHAMCPWLQTRKPRFDYLLLSNNLAESQNAHV
ncbi:hypothetical protein H5410_048618 [Solanum commersonii]|uniref:Uncharacterized protein n=1 Tax=Solanum commersonii TaxID=4109 RepID=A0A9J5XMA5_SOLCO|nr:hypothetical protein H5410_048618 [Solanum commersonii]